MGAEVFGVVGKGETLQQAFQEVKERARYDYGHRGYTGTIAEKDTAVLIEREQKTLAEAREIGDNLLDNQDPRVDDKWGPAGAIRVGLTEWYFFGWASS